MDRRVAGVSGQNLARDLAVLILLVSLPAIAQTITDGDTLKQGRVTYRLWGIDAPEAKQVCPDGWPAGSLAATRLQALTAGRSVICQEKDRDRYGHIVAICRASGGFGTTKSHAFPLRWQWPRPSASLSNGIASA